MVEGLKANIMNIRLVKSRRFHSPVAVRSLNCSSFISVALVNSLSCTSSGSLKNADTLFTVNCTNQKSFHLDPYEGFIYTHLAMEDTTYSIIDDFQWLRWDMKSLVSTFIQWIGFKQNDEKRCPCSCGCPPWWKERWCRPVTGQTSDFKQTKLSCYPTRTWRRNL